MRFSLNKFRLTVLTVFCLGLFTIAKVNAEELPTINLLAESLENFDLNFTHPRLLENKSYRLTVSNTNHKKKKKSGKTFAKKYGPLELGLKLNPLNFNNNAISVNIDLLKTYEIMCSKPNSIEDLTDAFKADPNYHIISPEIHQIIRGGLMPKDLWQTLNSLSNS